VQALVYRIQAAEKLASNHEAVTRFALRAVGTAGKAFSAPLADPNRKPNMEFKEPMSYALMCTANALLQGADTAKGDLGDGEWLGRDESERKKAATAVVSSLQYLRDRVGVPRDMQLPAARQFRAHLNLVIDTIKESQSMSD
jgi:glutathione S-transferase